MLDLVNRVITSGITLAVDGESRLIVSGPDGSITPEIQHELKEHKETLIALLAKPETPKPDRCSDCWHNRDKWKLIRKGDRYKYECQMCGILIGYLGDDELKLIGKL